MSAKVDIYIFEEFNLITESDLEKALGMVTPARRRKALEYVRLLDRKQCVVAQLMLERAVGRKLRDEDFVYGRYGKPMFRDAGMPYFSISHCREAVAVAVADVPVGVDVESCVYMDDVAREVFSEEEFAWISGDPARFAILWTRKESRLKSLGIGLTPDLKNLPALPLANSPAPNPDEIPTTSRTILTPTYACTLTTHQQTTISPC